MTTVPVPFPASDTSPKVLPIVSLPTGTASVMMTLPVALRSGSLKLIAFPLALEKTIDASSIVLWLGGTLAVTGSATGVTSNVMVFGL